VVSSFQVFWLKFCNTKRKVLCNSLHDIFCYKVICTIYTAYSVPWYLLLLPLSVMHCIYAMELCQATHLEFKCPTSEVLVHFNLKAMKVWNVLMPRCCDFKPACSCYVTGILSTDYTVSCPYWEVCLHATKSYVSCHAMSTYFFISLSHMLAYVPADRKFQERK
jgi:putative component of membrane protein insertase Oxa1/YidC/SpoIIIJ protein YidD